MTIKNTLAVTGLLASTMVSGCASINGTPLGHSTVTTNYEETCMTSTRNSLNLLVVGGSFTSNAFNQQCGRARLGRILISANMSHDLQADADLKGLGMAILGADDQEIANMVQYAAAGMPPIARARIEENVRNYRESLMAQGAAEARAELAPQITVLQNQVAAANSMYITLTKPEVCGEDQYDHLETALTRAYPSSPELPVSVSIETDSFENMGVNIDTTADNYDELVDDLCGGNFVYVSATQGVGADARRVYDKQFYQDQSVHTPTEDAPFLKLNPDIIVAYIAQEFGVSAQYAQDMQERQRALAFLQEQRRFAALEAQQQELEEQQAAAADARTPDADQSTDTTQVAEENTAEPTVDQADEVQTASLAPQAEVQADDADKQQSIETNDAAGLDCNIVTASYDVVRTYQVGEEVRSFEIASGQPSHYSCTADAGSTTMNFYLAANTTAGETQQVLANQENVVDRPNGPIAWVASLVY